MIDLILGIIGTIMYPLFSIIFLAVDGLQLIFRSFAGVGKASVVNGVFGWRDEISAGNSGLYKDTGIVYYLLHSEVVKNAFLSILMLAVILLVMFTVMAFIKNTYSAKPKTWQEIIGNALKGIINFVFVPACCLLGIWVSNIVLNAIDGATSTGGATRMSRKLFLCASYNANWYRYGNELGKLKFVLGLADNLRDKTVVINGTEYKLSTDKDSIEKMESNRDDAAAIVDYCYANDGGILIYDQVSVSAGYCLWNINYLILIVGGVFMLYALCSLAFGMIRRMFIIMMLFVISPALCAMYPLDEGKAVGSWKGDFIKQTISAYGAVAGLNLFFSLLPAVENISVFGSGGDDGFGVFVGAALIDNLVQLLIIISGLFVVKEFISMISGYIGAEDAYSKGASIMNSTKGAVKKYGEKTMKGASKRIGAFKAINENAKKLKADGHKGKAFWGERVGHGMSAFLFGETTWGPKGVLGAVGKKSDELMKSTLGVEAKDIKKAYKTGMGTEDEIVAKADKDAFLKNIKADDAKDGQTLLQRVKEGAYAGATEEEVLKKVMVKGGGTLPELRKILDEAKDAKAKEKDQTADAKQAEQLAKAIKEAMGGSVSSSYSDAQLYKLRADEAISQDLGKVTELLKNLLEIAKKSGTGSKDDKALKTLGVTGEGDAGAVMKQMAEGAFSKIDTSASGLSAEFKKVADSLNAMESVIQGNSAKQKDANETLIASIKLLASTSADVSKALSAAGVDLGKLGTDTGKLDDAIKAVNDVLLKTSGTSGASGT